MSRRQRFSIVLILLLTGGSFVSYGVVGQTQQLNGQEAEKQTIPLPVSEFADRLRAAREAYETIGATPLAKDITGPKAPASVLSQPVSVPDQYGDTYTADIPIKVELIGPTEPVLPGEGFQVSYTVEPKEARLTWKNEYPDKAGKPIKGEDEEGTKSLGFFRSIQGEYKFKLYAQVSVDMKDGYDPFDVAELVVTVGGSKPNVVVTPDGPTPVVSAPSSALQTIVAPLKTVTQASAPENVAKLKDILTGLSNVLHEDPPTTQSQFEDFVVSFINSAATQAGLAGKFPGHSAALDKAINDYFGTEDAALDKQKAFDFAAALIWTCQP